MNMNVMQALWLPFLKMAVSEDFCSCKDLGCYFFLWHMEARQNLTYIKRLFSSITYIDCDLCINFLPNSEHFMKRIYLC